MEHSENVARRGVLDVAQECKDKGMASKPGDKFHGTVDISKKARFGAKIVTNNQIDLACAKTQVRND